MSAAPAVRSIVIPLGKGDVLEVPFDEVPADAKELIEALDDAHAPYTAYHEAAVAYYRKGDFVGFEQVLNAAFADSKIRDPNYNTVEAVAAQVRLLIAVASYELAHGSNASRTRETSSAASNQSDAKARATRRYDEAARHIEAALTTARTKLGLTLDGVGAGYRFLPASQPATGANVRDRCEKAARGLPALLYAARAYLDLFRVVYTDTSMDKSAALRNLEGNQRLADTAWRAEAMALAEAERRAGGPAAVPAPPPFVPALLAAGGAALEQKKWADARAAFAKAIKAAPETCPSSARVGLGIALYRLGHLEAAQSAFKRALQLAPGEPMGLTLYATLELAALADHEKEEHMGGKEGGKEAAEGRTTSVTRSAAAARPIERLKRSYAVDSSSPLTSLELSHAYLAHWSPLHAGAAGGAAAAGSADAAVTAIVTRGSRRVLLSEDVSGRLHGNDTIQLLVQVEGKPTYVPMRLVSSAPGASVVPPVVVVPFSAVGIDGDLPHIPPALNAPGARVCVATCRHPWGLASAAGVAVHVLDATRAAKLARAAHATAVGSGLTSASFYALARALHAEGKYVDASGAYKRCIDITPDHIPARYGYALTLLQQRRAAEAIRELEAVVKANPADASAARTLALVQSERGAHKEALEAARTAFDAAPTDWQVAVLYGMLLATEDSHVSAERARKVFHTAAHRMRAAGIGVPAALHVNVAVLATRLAGGEGISAAARAALLSEAETQLERALLVVCQEKRPGHGKAELTSPAVREVAMLSPEGLTITFNLCRLYETTNRPDAAVALYARILERFPDYHDARLRLGVRETAAGRLAAARAHFEAVVERAMLGLQIAGTTEPLSAAVASHRSALVSALVLSAQVATTQGAAAEAKALYTRAVRTQAEHLKARADAVAAASSGAAQVPPACPTDAVFELDNYPQLSLANTLFAELYTLKPEDAVAREEILKKCFMMYKDALKRDPGCPYAAAGLAMVKAEQGHLDTAKAIFTSLLEAGGDTCVPAALNLGHIHVMAGNTTAAQQLYGHAYTLLSRSAAETGGKIPAGLATTLEKLGHGQGGHSGMAVEAASSLSSVASCAEVLLYTARTHVEAQDFEGAMVPLAQALALTPDDFRLQYNLAFVMAEAAFALVRGTNPGVAELERALDLARASQARFAYVLTIVEPLQEALAQATESGDAAAIAAAKAALDAKLTQLTVPVARLTSFRNYLGDAIRKLEGALVDARQRAARRAAEVADREAAERARAAEKAAAEAAVREAAQARRQQEQALAMELQREFMLRGIAAPPPDAKGGDKAGLAGKKRRREDSDTDEGAGLSEDEGVAAARKAKLAELFGSDDEDGGAAAVARKSGKKKPLKKRRKVSATTAESDSSSSSSSSSGSSSDSSSDDSDTGSSSSGSSSSGSSSSSASSSSSSSESEGGAVASPRRAAGVGGESPPPAALPMVQPTPGSAGAPARRLRKEEDRLFDSEGSGSETGAAAPAAAASAAPAVPRKSGAVVEDDDE